MTQPDSDLEFRRRRALWRASHRGMRELDLVLGAYARTHVVSMDGDAIAQFESILAAADTDLFDWIMGIAPVPAQYQGPVIDALRASRLRPESCHDG